MAWVRTSATTSLQGLRLIAPTQADPQRCQGCGTWQHSMFYELQKDSPEAIPVPVFQCANPNCGAQQRWVD